MRGRIRLAAVGLVALSVIGAMTSVAGATTTVNTWNVKADAGALDVTLAGKALEIGGGLTEADANSSNTAEAMGTGLCINGGTPVACPTDVTSPSGASFATTQKAIQNGANGSVAPGPACATPSLPLAFVTIDVGCGNASASESNGKPTAEGDGSILGGSVSMTMGNALSAMGIALPSSSNAPCAGVSTPPASSTPGSNTSPLPAPAASLLGTVTSLTSGLHLPTLLPSTVSTNSPTDSTCSILGGLANEVSGVPVLGPLVSALMNGTSLNSVMGTSLLSISAVESKSTVATGTIDGDGTETASAIGDALDVNILSGMLDIKIIPAVASATVDTTTGQTTENCTPGLLQVTVDNGTPNLVSLRALGTALNQLLAQLEASALAPLLDALIAVPAPGILNCDSPVTSDGGTSTSVVGGIANADLLPAESLVGVAVNDVSASASANTSSSAPATSPSSTPTATPAAAPAASPAAAPAAAAPAASTVPGVTSVHTGEFWAGSLPIILLTGMGLAGLMLIGRRRVFSVARSLTPFIRRRVGR
jgi:hypothetical protein